MNIIVWIDTDSFWKDLIGNFENRFISKFLYYTDFIEACQNLPVIKPILIALEVKSINEANIRFIEVFKDFSKDIPLVVIYSQQEELQNMAELKLVANNYFKKPYDYNDIVNKLKSLLPPELYNEPKKSSLPDFYIDYDKKRVEINGKEIILARKEYEVLEYLDKIPGGWHRTDELLEKVWGGNIGSESKARNVIKSLRDKLKVACPDFEFISSRNGFGYRLNSTKKSDK